MIPQETIAKILDAANVVEVINDFVPLKRSGTTYKACCPFHNEKTPSFYVSPSKGIWHCFGCNRGGTAVSFVMEYEKIGYPEAVRYLGKKYGIEVPDKEESPEEAAARQQNENLYVVTQFAQQFFADSLKTEEGRSIARAYFHSRGLEDATIEKYGLGWAPSDRRSMVTLAREKGYKDDYLVETGLAYKNENGSLSDRFYNRVVFPFHGVSGRVIAFGARKLDAATKGVEQKYVNSKESAIYDKSQSLYGIYFAKSEIARQDNCYLVEGYLDVLSMHQLGITNMVASSGTSLTEGQVRIIGKFTRNVTIMYDGDSAGRHATLRAIDLILAKDMNPKVVLLPPEDDPDSFARKHNLEEVREYFAANSQDPIAFKIAQLMGEAGNDPLAKAQAINSVADSIAAIPDAVKRATYIQAAAEMLRLDAEVISQRISKTREKIQDEERRSWEREQRRRDASAAESLPETPVWYSQKTVSEKPSGPKLEDPFLGTAESDILAFVLRSGTDKMLFGKDSDYYDPEQAPAVADFIRDTLEANGLVFVNTLYKKTYDAYFAIYDSDATLTQDDILKKMMDGEDREIADLTTSLTMNKYRLTVKGLEAALTNDNTRLVTFVPKSLLIYQSRVVQSEIRKLGDRLSCGEDPMTILPKIDELTMLRKNIDERVRHE